MRGLLLVALTVSILTAGCAEGPLGGDASNARDVPSTSDALALFTQAAGQIPDRYGLRMTIENESELMSADAVFDEPNEIGYFKIKMDPMVMAAAGGFGEMGGTGPMDEEGEIAVYATPEASAFVVGETVILTPNEEGESWMSGGGDDEGFDTLTNPEAFLSELQKENVTITSVTPTTLRGKAALKMDATMTDEEGTHAMTIYLFQEPSRVARIETTMPASEDDEQDPFAGARMTMDILYDDEISIVVPDGVKRVMGLLYESDHNMFGGGFGGGGMDDPETWTFQTSGGIALADVEAEVSDAGEKDAEPLWTMPLTEGRKSVDGLTLTYDDADGDGEVSEGDTLTIARGEGAEGMRVSLRDLVSGLRVTPGAGMLLAALALVGAAWAARRRA